MLTLSQNLALYPLLQHYIGSQVTSIIPNQTYLSFNTLLGERGELHMEDNGDWRIIIGSEIIDTIESEVFKTLISPDAKIKIEEYLDLLKSLGTQENISYRSRVLVQQILKVLEDYVVNSDYVPKRMIQVGPFIIFRHEGIKFMNCLN